MKAADRLVECPKKGRHIKHVDACMANCKRWRTCKAVKAWKQPYLPIFSPSLPGRKPAGTPPPGHPDG
ncbi:MAG: hypothetical protein SWH54_01280 [Thermodesulfobacteriota bacterium]|nr:hypothetical protein [Thermodesulfobacteriota bacterium]